MNETNPSKHEASFSGPKSADIGGEIARARLSRKTPASGNSRPPRKYSPRRGYAMLIVLVFVILFTSMLGVAWRQIGSVLRTETVRVKQMNRDQGSLRAAAAALRMLELSKSTDFPDPAPESEYDKQYKYKYPPDDENTNYYIVSFKRHDKDTWTVKAEAVDEEPEGLDTLPSLWPES